MKKLVIAILSILFMTTTFASETATLRMKIAGPIKDNRYFLCVSGVGCVSIFNGNKGRTFPIDQVTIANIYTVNATNMRLHTQSLPSSCNVTIKGNKTLTVTGKLIEGAKQNVYLSNLRCSLS